MGMFFGGDIEDMTSETFRPQRHRESWLNFICQVCTISGCGLATVGGTQWRPGQVVPALTELKDRLGEEEK